MQTATHLKPIPDVRKAGLRQLWNTIARPLDYLSDIASIHPDLFRTQVGGYSVPITLVHHPQAIEQIYANDTEQFSAPGDINSILIPVLGSQSLLNLDGDRHRRARKLMMPSFHGERMYHYGQKIVDIARDLTQQLPSNCPFLAQTLTQQITVRLILQIVLGIDGGDRYERIIRAAAALLNHFNSPLTVTSLFVSKFQVNWGSWSPWGRFLQLQADLDEAIYAEIADRHRDPDPSRTDILALMMSATDEDGRHLSDRELRDELMLLILAGHDTTALAMAWGLYWLHALPDIKQNVLAELAPLGDNPNPMDVFKLPYLTAVCQEVLRIHPVAAFSFPRRAEEEVDLMGYRMPKGENAIISIHLLHQRSDIYPTPHQFDPERFLQRKYSPYEFMPFGGGVRRCVGNALAMYELKLSLATLLQTADFTLLDRQEPKVQRRGVIFAPKGGIPMRVTQRN
ncbi:MAG: cytochrome P450 [Cyanobacteria bacterium J06597_1]